MAWELGNPNNPGGPAQLSLTANYQWDNEGKMASLQDPLQHQFYYQYDNVGRLIGMTRYSGTDGNGNPVYTQDVAAVRGPAGQLTSLSYGDNLYNGQVVENISYNNLLQVTGMTAQAGAAALMNMTYTYPANQNNGRIAGSNDGVTGENVTYTYDALNRLTGASAGSLWAETYSYDGFGNLTAKNATQQPAPVLGAVYDANNHLLGMTYDANGNQLWDSLQHATALGWNVENKLVTETSQAWPGAETWYSYDPWGRRVMKDVNPDPNGENGGPGYTGGAWEFYFYGVRGEKLVTAVLSYNSSGNLNWAPSNYTYNVYFGRKLISANGSYVVTDRLGSVRARDNVSTGWAPVSYFPYGEERTSTADDADKFATYFRDGPGQDYAGQRYYNNGTGRFLSVDPAGIKAANPANPASWNRYGYVLGDPVNRLDPSGREDVADGGGWDDDEDAAEDESEGGADGLGGVYYEYGGTGSAEGDSNSSGGIFYLGNYTTADIIGYTSDGTPIVGGLGAGDSIGVNGTTGQVTNDWTPSSGLPVQPTLYPYPIITGPAIPPAPPRIPAVSCIFSSGFFNAVLPGPSPNTPVGGGKAIIPPNSGQTNYGSGSRASGYGNTGLDAAANGGAFLIDWYSDMNFCLQFHT